MQHFLKLINKCRYRKHRADIIKEAASFTQESGSGQEEIPPGIMLPSWGQYFRVEFCTGLLLRSHSVTSLRLPSHFRMHSSHSCLIPTSAIPSPVSFPPVPFPVLSHSHQCHSHSYPIPTSAIPSPVSFPQVMCYMNTFLT